MMEFSVDKEEFEKQYQEGAEENGFVVKVYLQNVDIDKLKSELITAPNVNVKGYATPLNVATMIMALESLIEDLKEIEGAKECLSLLRFCAHSGEKITIREERGKKNE